MVTQKEHDNSPGTQFNVKEDCDLNVREHKTSVMNKFDKLQKNTSERQFNKLRNNVNEQKYFTKETESIK